MIDRSNDPFELNRFLQAQQDRYEHVVSELNAGEKQTHWIWFIFPQVDGLAQSLTAKHYSIIGPISTAGPTNPGAHWIVLRN